MKPNTIQYRQKDGTITEKPLPSGVIWDEEGNLAYDPAKDTDPAPDVNEQIKHLIGFIDYFKNTMTPKQIADFVRFMSVTITGGDVEKFNELLTEIDNAQREEQTEAAQITAGNPEAVLSDLPHNGYTLLKLALNDLRNLTPAQFEHEYKVLYEKTSDLLMMNAKPINFLFDGKTDFTEETGVRVGTVKKKPVIVNLKAYVAVDETILPAGLTPYDGEVFNGICSILATGQNIMTSAMIYEAFAGKRTTSPQALGHVTRSAHKIESVTNELDWTEHAKMVGLPLDGKQDYVKTRENMLLMRTITACINGQEVTAFQVLAEPILYTYAKMVGQIVTVDKALLDLNINNTDESIVIKNYLLRRIELMMNPRNNIKSNIIKFDTIVTECGLEGNRTQIKRYRDRFIFPILDSLKAKQYIKGYTVIKEGRRLDGIAIDYTPRTQATPQKAIAADKN